MRSNRLRARRGDSGRPEQNKGPAMFAKLRNCTANHSSIPTFPFCLCLYSRAKGSLQLPRLSMWRCKRTGGRFPPRRSQRAMAYPRAILNRLQSLVRVGILKGIRGPHGGYELARERRGVTANDILRAAGTVHEAEGEPESDLVARVVLPV